MTALGVVVAQIVAWTFPIPEYEEHTETGVSKTNVYLASVDYKLEGQQRCCETLCSTEVHILHNIYTTYVKKSLSNIFLIQYVSDHMIYILPTVLLSHWFNIIILF